MALLPKQGQPGDYLFPGRVKARMWHSSMLELLKELRPGRDLTGHHFRSTFRDWVSDKTSHAPNLAWIALHHVVGKKTEIRTDTLAVDRLAAGNAQRRQRDVEREARNMRSHFPADGQRAAQMAGDRAWW